MRCLLVAIVFYIAPADVFAEDPVLLLEYEFSRENKVVAAPSLAVKEGAESSITLSGGDSAPFRLRVVANTQANGTVFLEHQIAHGDEEFRPALVVKKGAEASIQIGDVLLTIMASDMEDDGL